MRPGGAGSVAHGAGSVRQVVLDPYAWAVLDPCVQAMLDPWPRVLHAGAPPGRPGCWIRAPRWCWIRGPGCWIRAAWVVLDPWPRVLDPCAQVVLVGSVAQATGSVRQGGAGSVAQGAESVRPGGVRSVAQGAGSVAQGAGSMP